MTITLMQLHFFVPAAILFLAAYAMAKGQAGTSNGGRKQIDIDAD